MGTPGASQTCARVGRSEEFITFISNYAERNAILLPGCVPGYEHDDIQLLQLNTTKKVRQSPSTRNVIIILGVHMVQIVPRAST